MKQKVLLLFAMLSLSVTGAWAWSYQKDAFFNANEANGIWYGGYVNNSSYCHEGQAYNFSDCDMIYENANFELLQYGGDNPSDPQNSQYSGGIGLDGDGFNAPFGIKFSGKGTNWIKSVYVTTDYSLGDRDWVEGDLTVSQGCTIENYKEENDIISFTIVVENSEFTFSANGQAEPQFNFVINYVDAVPVPLNTRGQLEGLVSDYKNNKALVYHTRDFKEGVATTICLPFAVEADETGKFADGSFYELTTVTYEGNEWVATMVKDDALKPVEGKFTVADKPYLFLPNKTKKIMFTGTINQVPGDADDFVPGKKLGTDSPLNNYTSRQWYMQGTYDRVKYANLSSGLNALENVYGFVSAFNTDEETGEGTAIPEDYLTSKSVYAGKFVRAIGDAYFPIFRAYLSYKDSGVSARRDASSNASAPSYIAVRLINNDGSVTKLDNVEIPVVSNVWYDLQGRRYNSKPAKAGIYMNNGKKMIVK